MGYEYIFGISIDFWNGYAVHCSRKGLAIWFYIRSWNGRINGV